MEIWWRIRSDGRLWRVQNVKQIVELSREMAATTCHHVSMVVWMAVAVKRTFITVCYNGRSSDWKLSIEKASSHWHVSIYSDRYVVISKDCGSTEREVW